MLFKLSLSNLRKSIKDYAIYFFTLIIGVAVFYVFSSVATQAAYMQVVRSRADIIDVFKGIMSALGVFVAGVLGLLIAYASRFLMKKRNREFALYMLLGMGKRKISVILFIETITIGLGSLAVGLLAGIGLSQFMSALVASLFEADLTAYRFTVSGDAVIKTIVYFGIMYIVVMIFNAVFIGKCKLIDLLQSGRRSEMGKAHNPWLCTFVFVICAVVLGYCYRLVAYEQWKIFSKAQWHFGLVIAAGCVCTFFIFWSVAGLLLRIAMSIKSRYYRGLNSFTFRQISSKVNTMVFSMTVICLMLFVAISALAASFSLRSSMNEHLKELCPVDFCFEYTATDAEGKAVRSDMIKDYEKKGINITGLFGEYVSFNLYQDDSLTYRTSLGAYAEEIAQNFRHLMWDSTETVVRVSDYNRLMKLYGRDELSLAEDEYIMVCNYTNMLQIRDIGLAGGVKLNVFGRELKPRYDKCVDGFIEIGSQPLNLGIIIIPDSAADPAGATGNYVIGNYKAEDKESKRATEDAVKALMGQFDEINAKTGQRPICNFDTKIDVSDSSVGLTAIITFMGLYVGLVFLISCGAILALKELSDNVDNVGRYDILRKIGAEERSISGSLFIQTGVFFILPLILGALHSVFGLKFAMYVFEVLGMDRMAGPVAATAAIIVLIYGGYFLITYFSDRAVIRAQR